MQVKGLECATFDAYELSSGRRLEKSESVAT
jgi:hypothetical protein